VNTEDQLKDVITLIATNPNWKDLCLHIAQSRPQVFCAAFHEVYETLESQVKRVYVEEGFIPAIKYHRNETGKDLKTSKGYVETVCADLEPAVRN